ncbi:MAG: Cof-type HAD-IIB family hydrolase [Candidatus Ruminococcus intestinipullorum]|nr:Cof-type HAD-IIB family hydrolase [Candidatus Ruminococcus intestinipullorum]
MIKLVASDLDGTLLQNGSQELSPRAIRLISELIDRGVHFVSASGRQYDNQKRLFGDLSNKISFIAENGSMCIHDGELVSLTTIEKTLANRILEELKKQSNFEILVSTEKCCYLENNVPEFVNHIVNVLKNTTQVIDDVRNIQEPIIKIAICSMQDGSHIVDKYLQHLQSMFGNEIKVVTSGNIWIDFIAPGSNKGTALLQLMNLLHIQPDECLAFGDQYNDIEMLQAVGTSYAMSNAAPGISYYSNFVTNSVEDVLEELLLDI